MPKAGPGRPKGSPNKITTDVKQAIVKAFDAVGGHEYLVGLATSDPKAFCTLLGKTVPVSVAGDQQNPVRITMTIDRPPDETREQWLARRYRELGISPPVAAAAGATNGRDRS